MFDEFSFNYRIESEKDDTDQLGFSEEEAEEIAETVRDLDLVEDIEKINLGDIWSLYLETEYGTGIGVDTSSIKTSIAASEEEILDIARLLEDLLDEIYQKKKEVVYSGSIDIRYKLEADPDNVLSEFTNNFGSVKNYNLVGFDYEFSDLPLNGRLSKLSDDETVTLVTMEGSVNISKDDKTVPGKEIKEGTIGLTQILLEAEKNLVEEVDAEVNGE